MNLITLENGLRIFTSKREDLRSATLGIWVASGSVNETEQNNGISHFIEHIVFKGTDRRTAAEIAEGMDRIGAQVNAYTTKEYTFFYTRALSYHIEEAADILLDMVKNPRLFEEDIKTEKGVILEEIAMCEDDPGEVCYEMNETSLFDTGSLALQILGTRESVSSLTKEDFISHMSRFYVPERMVIGIGGNFDEKAMISKIKAYFGSCKNTANPLTASAVPFNKGIALKKKSFEQTHMVLSFEGVSVGHEDHYPLQVCLFILGMGGSSRLNQRIREQLGLVYSIDAWPGRYLGGGYNAVSMSLSPSAQETALFETCKIIKNFAATLTQKELEIAKEKLISSLIMSREQPHSKLSSLGFSQLMLSKFVEDDDIINSIKCITLEKIKATAEKYLKLENAAFAAVGKVRAKSFYEKIIKEAAKAED